ncbi:hypothetical protein JMN32_15125 [Fulvivirga sp. 29W222]|uniref:Uncharacterized protein n=1 Tax=Fulvivirga marina TaxID=2494733 RepID=A0A937KEY8_9BACT|nr:hypothetical protein [Fulvivirga marina]MBL6447648.1 hypothetical protein [Fulvivirga marina]
MGKSKDLERPVTMRDIAELQLALEESFTKLIKSRMCRPNVYTASKFSEITGVRYIDIIEQCVKGLLHAYREGTTWMIYASELEKFKIL